MSSKFSSKMIFDQKNILVKKLEANWCSFVKKERTSKTNKILMTIIKNKKVKKAFHPYPSYSFTKKVVQKIRIEGSRCGSDVGIPCSHSSLFLFALGLKDGNRRILVCFPPYCNKPHFFPQSFSFFLSFQIDSSNL